MLRSLFLVFTIIAYGSARCYDQATRQSFRRGETYTKIQPMGHLNGTYECSCGDRGRISCIGTDLPCLDSVTKHYVKKGRRFNTIHEGIAQNCICRGGFGTYDSCTPGHRQAVRCHGVNGKKAKNGGKYIIVKYGWGMRCRCQDGKPVESSCRRVCLDSNTRQVVKTGQKFTLISRGKPHTCTCTRGSATACKLQPAELDPCIFGLDDCDSSRANCISQGTTYTCECMTGYEGDGRSCNDVDECSGGDHGCDLNAACTNTEGSYTCECNEGYSGDGRICIGSMPEESSILPEN